MNTEVSESSIPTKSGNKYLRRSKNNKILGGVAGGIGEYFAIDPTVVRLGFVLLTLLDGVGILLYLVLWAIMPATDSDDSGISQEQLQKNFSEIGQTVSTKMNQLSLDGTQSWWGWLLVGLGLLFLALNFDLIDLLQLHVYWPLLLVLVGIVIVARRK